MEVVISSLIKLVCDKVTSKGLAELGLLMKVEKELRKLENTLSTIQDVLEDAEARQTKEKALRGWLKKLKDVAYDADDLLDEVAAKAIKLRPEMELHLQSSKKKKVSNLSSIPKEIIFRYKIANKLKEIRKRLDEIAAERSKFHLKEGAAIEWKEESGEREQTGSFVNESEVYGRNADRDKIVDFLTSRSGDDNPRIIPIVGLGGLGKTTLAQLAYNDERVCKHFEKRIWVCVSDDFEIRRLIRLILESVSGQERKILSLDSMQQSLRDALSGRRFLLVLDDVWNESHEKWDRLRFLLASGAAGSRVIVTTRSERVASITGTVAPHFMTGLSEEDCWALFEKRAFGLGAGAKTPSLVAIGKEIVKKCGGVPLAAKALGSLMRFKRGESEWLSVKDNEIWRLSNDENDILPALKLSYNHLPSHLKPCFGYCSIFPKDYVIRKEIMVQLWMAEGFIQLPKESSNVHLRDVGYQYLDELQSRSLLQNGGGDTDGVVRQVKMHDLVHDLACFVAGDECSIVGTGFGRAISQSSRYTSFTCDGSHGTMSAIVDLLDVAKKLRTFYLIKSKGEGEEQDKIQAVLTNMFSSLRLLRALHLKHYPMKELPVAVQKLRHLRYLNLAGTQLEVLPSCINELRNLQTLDLSCCRALRVLPDSLGELCNLVTLDLEYCLRLVSLPSSFGCLKNLRKLNLSLCQHIQTLPESMSCLTNLQMLELRHCYSIRKLPKNMKNMRSLVHLDLKSCCELTSMPQEIGALSHLRTLSLFIPSGNSKCSITELRDLRLEGELKLLHLENVKNAAEAEEAKLKEKQSLRSVRLSWDFNTYINGGSLMDLFEGRVSLDLDVCEAVQGVLEGLQPHANLEELEIEGYIGHAFPSWVMELPSYQNLADLTLKSCIICEYLPALGQLPSLKFLRLSFMWNIRCLGSEFYGGDSAFPALEGLELSNMPLLVEWTGNREREIFPRLTKLSLKGCPSLRSLPTNFPTVSKLNMEEDDELLLIALQNGGFPNLEHMDIENCDEDGEMPEVISQRLRSIEGWTKRSKPRPSADDPSVMSITGTGKMNVRAGVNVMALPI